MVTTHSVLLCALLAPLGFLSHMITCFVTRGASSGSSGGAGAAAAAAPAAGLTGIATRTSSGVPDRPANGALRMDLTDSESEPPRPPKLEPLVERVAALAAADEAAASSSSSSLNGASPSRRRSSSSSGGRNGGSWLTGRRSMPDWLTVEEPVYVDRK